MINRNILKHVHAHNITEEELYDAYKLFFGTLVSEPRLKILNLLKNGKKNVTELINELKMDQTLVSHNLRRLKRCGFVSSKNKEKFRYYSINNRTIKPLMETIDKHMSQYCIHILRTMKGGDE